MENGGKGRKKREKKRGVLGGDVAMGCNFLGRRKPSTSGFYLARMRQGKRIRGNEAQVRRRADGGEEPRRGKEGKGNGHGR